MSERKTCPVCGCKGTYTRHEDGYATCSNCGMIANDVAADFIEEICAHRFEGQPDENERTCHNTHKNRWFECSECGYGFIDLYPCDETDINEQPHYCLNCGARVVDE